MTNKQTNAQILADSFNIETGDRLTTFLLHRFPKCLLAEINTHRMLSRNAASSRAIPIEKMIERIKEDPYIPTWTANQKGIQGKVLDDAEKIESATSRWLGALEDQVWHVKGFIEQGIHKQNANRLLEPFMRVPVIISGTEWGNFFKLRCDEATHPDFCSVAREMHELYTHKGLSPQPLEPGQWHCPMFEGMGSYAADWQEALKAATARCARISYTTHDGGQSLAKDIALHDRLLESGHMSPFEHCAMAVRNDVDDNPSINNLFWWHRADDRVLSLRNYRGFYSYRAHIEDEMGVQN